MLAPVVPECQGMPGCAGPAAALGRLAGVVDGSCVERSLPGNNGNPPTSATCHSSLSSANITDSADIPWPPCGAALSVSRQYWIPSQGLGTL